MKKKICIIYTGGTIGMVMTDKGYAPKDNIFESMLRGIDDLSRDEMPEWDVIEFNPLLDSSNITYEQWNMIGSAIHDNYHRYDGFVILHGTDTMAYTASALSFMLQNLSKPVVITGSQIPLTALRSDGRENIITSLMIAAEGRVKEVCLYFGGKLLRGNRATKVSADNLIAFDSPNMAPLARVGISIDYMDGIDSIYSDDAMPLKFHRIKHIPIGVIKVFPGIQFALYEPIISENIAGIVLETFGTGNIPGYDDKMIPIIKRAFDKGVTVVVCSQCLQGTVKLGIYETSNALAKAGAISGYDLTTEAAVAKLYYLYSIGTDKNDIKQLMEKNICGEMSN